MGIKRKKTVLFTFLLLAVTSYYHISSANEAGSNEASKIKIERHFVFDTIPMNLKEITDSADRIFAGKCIKAEEKEYEGLPVTEYKFKVTEAIKGVTDEEITFRQWQPTVRDGGYTEGNKYILFLFPDSEKGLTSPVGFAQGKFEVETTGFIRRKEVVKNSLNNRGLNRNLKTQKRIAIKNNTFLNDYVHRCSELGIPMRYKEFVEAVKNLVEE
ncbi:MAG: hypothetical protein A3B68_05620 [Candidatus Melainabacteria bacterium RIFCSPHIGHO2_02_FULL_34_12]|nr:MAG: hypothetical protein A3B68_05620 [Candidatus Melainabacteria bacterium RIFCSPHIGHO2_02_FULL_34_12]